VSDGYEDYEFQYTLTALFNEPPDNLGGSILDYEIELFDSMAQYKMNIGNHCDDPEDDLIYEYIYYDETVISDSSNELKDILTFDKVARTLTIDDSIRTLHDKFTYQMMYSCTDKYNPDTTIDTPFRIVVVNTDDSPRASDSQPLIEMFYEISSYEFSIDTSVFTDDNAIVAYTAVGTLN